VSTLPLPTLVRAQLMVAAKIEDSHKRIKTINEIIKEARLYYPECFSDLQGITPKARKVSKFEQYVSGLRPLQPPKYHIIIGD